jgi:uncharacterized protein (DUF885 family)
VEISSELWTYLPAYNRSMGRNFYKVSIALAIFAVAACGPAPAPAPVEAGNAPAPHDNLRRMVDRYWDERVAPGNPLSPQFLADSLAIERRFLAEVSTVPRDRLDEEAKLTYDIFKSRRELDIEGFTYPAELLPVEPFDGMPWNLARDAADLGQYPLPSAGDYENWLRRIGDFSGWTRQAILNMREGMRRGYTAPREVMERTLPLLRDLGTDSSANVFYAVLRTMPESVKEPERTRLSAALAGAVRDNLLPAYRDLHDFIQNEYLPNSRRSLALSALPLGPSWYAYRVKRATGTHMTAKQIHAIGIAEVERLRSRMPPQESAPPAAAADLVNAYLDLKTQTLGVMPALFSTLPEADFEIRAAPAGGLQTVPLLYRLAVPKRGIPAVLYVDTAATAGQPPAHAAIFLQEAIPGRHLQAALQQERTDLPKFRRFGREAAFVDGWALYAATLGSELGLYRDEEAKRNASLLQLKCAVALVVDTGLHAMDWTRAQAVDYLGAQLAVDAAAAGLMIDRFAAEPGDALACGMGELEIQALRSRAQQLQGTRFDIREFHGEILKDGAMPLDILEQKMKLWMAAGR